MTTTPELLALRDLCSRIEAAGVGYMIDLWIVSREDLILSKLDWARDSRSELQLRDVRHLLEGPLDADYLRRWAVHLGVEQLLEEVQHD